MAWWDEIGRAIQPIFQPPGTGAGGAGAFNMREFLRITGQFWAAIRAADLAAASTAFDRAMLYVAQTGGTRLVAGHVARMGAALADLEVALAALAEGAIEAAPGTIARGGGAFVLGEGGMILLVVFFTLWALRGGGASPVYADSMPQGGGWPVRDQPHPVYTADQWQRIVEQPNGWRTLIVGPAPRQSVTRETQLAAQVMLARARAFGRGDVQGPVRVP